MKDVKSIEKYYQNIWTAIQLSLSGDICKIIVFSSAVTGEGVTTTVTNIAKIAAKEKRVLLIEANIEKPVFPCIFNLSQKDKLIDFVSGKFEIDESVKKKDEIKNLSIISAGSPGSPLSTLQGWELLFEKSREIFDIVLIDALPVISNPDTVILSSKCDGLVLVIQADKTRREVIERAKRTIDEAKVNLIGTVLNQRAYKIPKFIYKRL